MTIQASTPIDLDEYTSQVLDVLGRIPLPADSVSDVIVLTAPLTKLLRVDLPYLLGAMRGEIEQLRDALGESLKLQSHYAELLNMHDGGERVGFASVDAWIERLREVRSGGRTRATPSTTDEP
jgi:hypothetical protein